MVVILTNHFNSHFKGVVKEGLRLRNCIDYRNFHRCEYAEAVTGFKHGRVLRIMRDSKEIAAHLLEKFNVTEVELVTEGIAGAEVVLMTRSADELAVTAVKEESLLGVKGEPPKSEGLGELVQKGSALPVQYAGMDRVEIRIFGIPEMRVGDAETLYVLFALLAGSELERGTSPGDSFALSVANFRFKGHGLP